ncbi:MAG: lysylphosphatidylglycerol synthase transmembrane domain-containing protein [Acidobacteriaceae bacterium]
MKGSRRIWTVGLLVVVGVLIYFQFHSLSRMSERITALNNGQPIDWKHDFKAVFTNSPGRLLIALALIYLGYFGRALRWKIFLAKIKRVPLSVLVSPQYIGFSGLVLLGRAGEFIRPYLIARKTGVKFTSQMAILVVERIFDMGAFALIVALNIAVSTSLRGLPFYAKFRTGSFVLLGGVFGFAVLCAFLYRAGPRVVRGLREHSASNFRQSLADKVDSFSAGLHVLSGVGEVVAGGAVSIATWLLIAGCYLFTVHAFGSAELQHMNLQKVLLLMFFSVAGGVIQLPGVGGGAQVVTIWALNRVFGVPIGIAALGGILLWLMTSVSVLIPGLLLARSEHVSLTALSQASEAAAEPARIG